MTSTPIGLISAICHFSLRSAAPPAIIRRHSALFPLEGKDGFEWLKFCRQICTSFVARHGTFFLYSHSLQEWFCSSSLLPKFPRTCPRVALSKSWGIMHWFDGKWPQTFASWRRPHHLLSRSDGTRPKWWWAESKTLIYLTMLSVYLSGLLIS
jgi:hypothetical protein